jgi:hypothetical protein
MLERIKTDSEETAARVAEVKVDVLRALGRVADADALAASLPSWDDDDVEIVVFDAEDDDADDDDAATSGPDEGEPEARGPRDDHSEDREDPAP